MANLQRLIFQLAYEISPIILVDGIAKNFPLSVLPIVAITEAGSFTLSILNGKNPLNPNSFFAHFKPMQGSTLLENDVADYPFANQTYAANAMIAKPKHVSMLMLCPANSNGGAYVNKLATFTLLQQQLSRHIQLGGTFTVLTPSFIYTNCLLTNLIDASTANTNQVQNAYQFDFVQPLITLSQAQQVLNSLMNKYSNLLPNTTTSVSSLPVTVGTPVLTPNTGTAIAQSSGLTSASGAVVGLG